MLTKRVLALHWEGRFPTRLKKMNAKQENYPLG